MADCDLTAQRLRDLFDYNLETGAFTRRSSVRGTHGGTIAGYCDATGYRRIQIDRRNYLAHRLAWLYVHGVWPSGVIDHINGDPSDNRMANLRDTTAAVNNQNLRAGKSNNKHTTLLGVKKNGTGWAARIRVDGKQRNLGTFRSPEEAHAVYLETKRALHLGCQI